MNEGTLEFMKESGIHGLPLIASTKSIITKVAWGIFIVGALGASIYYTTSLIVQYQNQPTATAIVVRNPEQGVKFPATVICTLFRVSKRRAAAHNITSREQAEYLFASFGPLYTTQDYNLDYFNNTVLGLKADEIAVAEGLIAEYGSIFDVMEKIATDCTDIVTDCRLNGDKISKANCCARSVRYFTREGPCFYFKALDDYYQMRPGRIGGFRVELNLPDDDIIPHVFSGFYQRGVFVYLQPFDAALSMDPFLVPLGSYALMQLRSTQYTTMSSKEKPCVKQDGNMSKYFNDFSQRQCIFECMADVHINICGCMELNTFLYYHKQVMSPDKLFCSPMHAYECAQKKINKRQIVEHCYLHETCPERCSFWHYDATLSSSAKYRKLMELPEQEYHHTNVSSEFAITLAMFYADIQYTVVEEYPAETPESLISSIGGLFGLWLGCSALSVVHALYFLVHWIFRHIWHRELCGGKSTTTVWAVQRQRY